MKKGLLIGCGGLIALFIFLAIILTILGAIFGDASNDEKISINNNVELNDENNTEEETKKVEDNEANNDETKEKVKEEKTVDPEEELKDLVKDISNVDVISVKGYFAEEPFDIQIEYLGKENLTKKLTVGGMKMAIIDTVYAMKESDYEFDNIGISVKYPLVGEYGNEENQYVIKSDFNKETVERLSDDKNKVNRDKLNSISSSWWEHPAISK